VPSIAQKKQRGVIVKMLDRLAEARVKRSMRAKKGASARNDNKPSK
jgi:hypothetical protein